MKKVPYLKPRKTKHKINIFQYCVKVKIKVILDPEEAFHSKITADNTQYASKN